MEDRFIEENVKTRLIISGIHELEENGIAGFSLRRAASLAQVSCAAPYRHFKSKEEYINQIILYVISKWELLSKEIFSVYKNDYRFLVIEISIANLRFRIANRNFPLALAHNLGSGGEIDNSIIDALSLYCEQKGLEAEDSDILRFSILTLIYGAVLMVNETNAEEILDMVRKKLNMDIK